MLVATAKDGVARTTQSVDFAGSAVTFPDRRLRSVADRGRHRAERRAMNQTSPCLGAGARQRGLSLVTTLVLMLATLGLGVAVMGVNVMEERLIANTKDRDLALQAAEAALRDAEQDVATNVSPATAFSDTCTNGLCTPPSQRDSLGALASLPVDDAALGFDWTVDANVRHYGQYTGGAQFPSVAAQPRYVIEKFSFLGTPAGESVVLGAEPTAPASATGSPPRRRRPTGNGRRPPVDLRDALTKVIMKPVSATPCPLAALLLSVPLAGARGAAFAFSNFPLFLAPAIKPNVMVILDNSESMDATMAGKVINGDDPNTRGNIARGILRGLLTSYRDAFNFGITSFATSSVSLYNTHAYYLGNATTMVYTNDCVDGISASNAGRRCIANPQTGNGFAYITYERSGDDADINDVLYSGATDNQLYGIGTSRHELQRLQLARQLGGLGSAATSAAATGRGTSRRPTPASCRRWRRRRASSGSGAAGATATTSPAAGNINEAIRADSASHFSTHDDAARQRDQRRHRRDQEQRLLHADRRHAEHGQGLLPRQHHADHADLPAQLRDARDRRQPDRAHRRQPVRPVALAEHGVAAASGPTARRSATSSTS